MTAAEKSKAHSNIIIESLRLGVWNLRIAKTTGLQFTQIKSVLPLFYRLCSDIFTLAPRLFTFFVFCQIWQGVEDAFLMHFSSLLLRRVCHGWLYRIFNQRMGSRLRKVSSREILMLRQLYLQQHTALRVRF